jgi:rubrerythrin
MKYIKPVCFVSALLAVFSVSIAIPMASDSAQDKTLANLMAAYNGESNANAKYLAYAEKADEEGYAKAASLFRAVAGAEKIHLTNHARVIEGLGGTPKADIKLPAVKSTKENLADAVKGESYERSTMYPEFIRQAAKDGNSAAVRTFNYALAAETEHAKLYSTALIELAEWKAPQTDFYVCPICGYTVKGKPSFAACPVCRTPATLYKAIN